ncbi:MAG: single-stranded-DNA-specific exonuclease RecJ [Rhodospirillaceae bacterium]|nr:single-stranded-DNA-specific exonuclease RecJ [Rhodospirillaceae bacterium]
MTSTEAFLGVARSVTNARWQAAQTRLDGANLDRAAAAIAEHFPDMPLPVTRILAGQDTEDMPFEHYLDPKLRDLLPNPSRFKDMDRAATRLADAVEAGTPIGVFGDYDVDGAAAAALLVNVLGALGLAVDVHIPDRMREGYGPNAAALAALQARGAELILTVDCGIAAHEPIAAVADTGMDVIVIDHHLAGPELPRAHSVINPNRLDEDQAYGNLCAAGVTFIVLVALLRELRRRNFFTIEKVAPDLRSQLDLVGLATVCDVVPLTGLNRAFVMQGLKVLAGRSNPGLAALADAARLNRPPTSHTFGFLLGPRINAGGRIGQSDLGVRLLSTLDGYEAAGLAANLDELNTKRRAIELEIRAHAMDMAAEQADSPVILVGHNTWHEGVIGIVAGRLREAFGKPACVVAFNRDGCAPGKGSGRSIPGFRLGSAIIAAHQAGILAGGGGHDMAAGFSIDRDAMRAFAAFLSERFAAEIGVDIPQLVHSVAGMLSTAGAQPELADWLDRIGPFGSGNPEPRFALPDCRIVNARAIGADGAHVSCRLDDGSGNMLGAIAFQAGGNSLGNALMKACDGQKVHVLGRIRRDHFRGGRAMQLEIEDVAPAQF